MISYFAGEQRRRVRAAVDAAWNGGDCQATQAAEQIQAALERHYRLPGHPFRVSVERLPTVGRVSFWEPEPTGAFLVFYLEARP